MERSEQRRVVEALILASPEPISGARLADIVPSCSPGDAKDLVNELNTEYQEQDRSFEIWEVAGGYQIRTRAEFSGYLQQLQKQRPLRLSRAALDTLAIVAYKQPVTRAEIEAVRGVDAGAVLKGLLDRRLIRIAGQRDVPGRPMLYGTSRRFLEVFGLDSLKNLPSLRELKDLADQKGVVLPGEDASDAVGEGSEPSEEEVESAAVETLHDASPLDSGDASGPEAATGRPEMADPALEEDPPDAERASEESEEEEPAL